MWFYRSTSNLSRASHDTWRIKTRWQCCSYCNLKQTATYFRKFWIGYLMKHNLGFNINYLFFCLLIWLFFFWHRVISSSERSFWLFSNAALVVLRSRNITRGISRQGVVTKAFEVHLGPQHIFNFAKSWRLKVLRMRRTCIYFWTYYWFRIFMMIYCW
jgi:hypothetical protein